MNLNPFSKIEDIAIRRQVESFARGAAKLGAGYLVSKGLIGDSQTDQFIDLASGLALFAYSSYQSHQAIGHAEKEVKEALELPQTASRETVDVLAKIAK